MQDARDSAYEISELPPRHAEGSPLSVALLFYIMTLCAIAVACIRTLATNEYATWSVTLASAAIAGLLGLLSGIVAGLVYRSRGLDFFLFPVVGIILGAFAGLLLIVDVKHFLDIMTVAFVGSWTLIVMMLYVARKQIA